MQEDQQLNEDENRLIQSLSGLLPGAPDISEQTIWYEAGRRAGRRQVNVWRGVAAAIFFAAGGAIVMRPNATPVNIVRVEQMVQTPGAGSKDVTQYRAVASVDYLRLRDAVEQRGMEALPQSGGSGVLSQPSQTAWPIQGAQPGGGESISPKGSL